MIHHFCEDKDKRMMVINSVLYQWRSELDNFKGGGGGRGGGNIQIFMFGIINFF